jgi:hypothetical protein
MAWEHGMTLRWTSAAALALILLSAGGDGSPAQTVASEVPHPVLVELFTSEGCSSCPPADALLRKLEGMHTDTGQQIVALSEHVTYWNRLGWADPFSSETFTARQSDYGDRFQLDEVYTPQVVVNGDRQVVGNDASAVLEAVRQQSAISPLKVEVLPITSEGRELLVTYAVSGAVPRQGAEVYVVLADDLDTTYVGRGENAGRTLSHVSVARSLLRVATVKAAEQRTVMVAFPERAGVQYAGSRHVVVFAQLPGLGKVLDVASRPVPQTFPTAPPAVAAVH